MKVLLRSLLIVASVIVWMGTPSKVQATPVPPTPNPLDFSVVETVGFPGQYTVFNNSSYWYVRGLYITHSPEATDPVANRPTWSAFDCPSGCLSGPTFQYVKSNSTSNAIAPGTSSNDGDFLFNAIFVNSDYRLLLTDGTNLASVDGVTATPLPATLPLMGSALGAGWLIMRRRKRQAASVGV